MTTFNPQQKFLFSAEYLLNILGIESYRHPLKKYQLLFDHLNCSPIEKPLSEGRPPVSKSGLLRALVYKHLKPLPTLYDLAVELVENPGLSLKLGLNPPQHPSPLVERLSSFLRDTSNDSLQQIIKSLVRELIQLVFPLPDTKHASKAIKFDKMKGSTKSVLPFYYFNFFPI